MSGWTGTGYNGQTFKRNKINLTPLCLFMLSGNRLPMSNIFRESPCFRTLTRSLKENPTKINVCS